jgi:hypothetical protein
MKAKWKKFFFWSSLGSLALGATLAVAKKPKRKHERPLIFSKIPGKCQRLLIWTERLQIEEAGAQIVVRDKYILQPTPFKVWNIMDLATAQGEPSHSGASIFHASHFRLYERGADQESAEEAILQDRFYGTITAIDTHGKSRGAGYIARGGILEIRKCRVGGANNGVETGEVHHSIGKILNFRFEYNAA